MNRLPARARRVVVRLGVAIGLLACVLLIVGLFLHSGPGLNLVRERAQLAFNDSLCGSLEIGEITELRGFHLNAENVRFMSADGEEVISIGHAEASLDVWSLLSGEIRLDSAHATDVDVHITPGTRFDTSIEDIFSTESSASEDSGGGGGVVVDTRAIRVEDARLRVAMGGPEINVRDISGAVRVLRQSGLPVRVRLDNMRGRYHGPGSRLLDAPSFRASGVVRAEHNPVLELDGRLCLDSSLPFLLEQGDGNARIELDASDHRLLGAAMHMAAAAVSGLEVHTETISVDAPACPTS